MLHMIFGRAGTGKTYLMRKLFEEQVKTFSDGIILIVPEQYSFESERALLRQLGAADAAKVEVLSFTRLCDRVFSLYGGVPIERLDDTSRAVIMGQALNQIKGELTLYGKQVGSAPFVNAMLQITTEFKQWGIVPTDLLAVSARQMDGLLKEKARDIALIMATYEALVEQSYVDPQNDLTLLAEKLEKFAFFGGKLVVMDSFKGFTVQQLKVLEKIFMQAKEVYITLCTDHLGASDEELSLFCNINKMAKKLTDMAKRNFVKVAAPVYINEQKRFKSEELRHLERNIFDPAFLEFENETENIVVCSAQTVYDEADFVARTIKKLVRVEGIRYREIAVIARSIGDYNGVLDTAFLRYGIPLFMDTRKSVAAMALMKFITTAFDIVIGGFHSDDIFIFLKTGLAGLDTAEISVLENYVYMWNISGGRWFFEWESNPEGFVEGVSEESMKVLAEINGLRKHFVELINPFAEALSGESAVTFAKAAYELIVGSGADKALRQFAILLERNGEIGAAEDERRSFDKLISILDASVSALKDIKLSVKEYAEFLELAISLADLGSLPQGLDDVNAGSAERMRPAEPRIVFVIGANEGVFPKDLSSSGLFSNIDRAKLFKMGIEIADNAETQAVEENYLFYTSVCAASEKVYLSYVRSDSAGKQLMPSSFVTAIIKMFPQLIVEHERVDYDNCNTDLLCQVEAVMPTLELTARVWRKKIGLSVTLKEYFGRHNNPLFESLTKTAKNGKKTLSPYNAGKLFGENINISATRIDVFHKCRFSYFCQYGLRAMPFRTAELDVLERGSLVHYVLEKLLRKYGGKGLSSITKEETATEIRMLLDVYLSDVMGGKADKSKRILYLIERIAVMLESLVEHIAAEFGQSLFEATEFELAIDESESGIQPVRLVLPDGGSITVRGKIDRVDTYRVGNDVYVRIVDYKTGIKKLYLSDVLYGQNLQMLLYLFAIAANGEDKFGGKIIPSGILYMPSKRTPSDVSRYAGDEELLLDIRKKLKMNGLILNDKTVFEAMEKDGLGIFTPFKMKADGTPDKNSAVADMAMFGAIDRHINKLLVKMGQTLHRGDIAVEPLDGVNDDACKYCDYRGACGREETEENEKIENLTSEEITNAFLEVESNGI